MLHIVRLLDIGDFESNEQKVLPFLSASYISLHFWSLFF
jgi:hypothetical protein